MLRTAPSFIWVRNRSAKLCLVTDLYNCMSSMSGSDHWMVERSGGRLKVKM